MVDIDRKITQLNPIALPADSGDLLAIVDISVVETKNITKSGLFGGPGPIGIATPSTGEFTAIGSSSPGTGEFTTLSMQLGTSINEFSTDGTLSGNSDDALVTEKAIKTYINQFDLINVRHIGSDSTAINGDVVLVDATSAVVTLTEQQDARIYVKSLTSTGVTLKGNTGTVDGSSTYLLADKNEAATIVCDGVNWFVL